MELSDILNSFHPIIEGDKRDIIRAKQKKHQNIPTVKNIPKFEVKFARTNKYDSNYVKVIGKYISKEEKRDVNYTITYVERYLKEHGNGDGLPNTILLPSGNAQNIKFHEWKPLGQGKYDFHIPGADIVIVQIQQDTRSKPPIRYITFLDIGNHSNTGATQ
jgi:hypothetical protein